jgi:hypothetical protein
MMSDKTEMINDAIQRFAMSEFTSLKQAFDFYLYGFCPEFAVGLKTVLEDYHQESTVVSLWGMTSGLDVPVWFHDCVLFDGLYWDISGSHTLNDLKKFWSKNFMNIEVRESSGIISREADFSEKELGIIINKFKKSLQMETA